MPPGSINRGKRLVVTGQTADGARRLSPARPAIWRASRAPTRFRRSAAAQPTYLLRQMLAFRNGTRANEAAVQMAPVVEKLTLSEMIDVVAYLGSLYPQ